jgi:CRISPR-associated protein Cas1
MPEKTFRARMIDAFDDREILKEAVATVNRMIAAGLPKAETGNA